MTHQSDEKEEHQKCSPQHGLAEHVAIADSWHRDDEKINTCPVGELMWIVELQRIARILQLRKASLCKIDSPQRTNRSFYGLPNRFFKNGGCQSCFRHDVSSGFKLFSKKKRPESKMSIEKHPNALALRINSPKCQPNIPNGWSQPLLTILI